MILVDTNQVMIATIMAESNFGKDLENMEIQENLIRHMFLNCLRSYKVKYGSKYGEMILACDDTNYWRKDLFPYYKHSRREEMKKSKINWNAIFKILNKIRDEVKENFPYRVIQIDNAEADDIIATLCLEFGSDIPGAKRILILSGDKDFQQLQMISNVDQEDPIRKKTIVCSNPQQFLKEHIIRGDEGDGIPNFLSPDNSLALRIRQKSIMQKKLDSWINQEPEQFCDNIMLQRYQRNRALIDLTLIPEHIKKATLESYRNQEFKFNQRSNLFNYFMANNLKHLMKDIGDF